MKNQKGVTLIELLATITILSIIGVIIWSVFIQGTKYSNTAMTKNRLIQESNIVIANLKNIHQNADTYEIELVNGCDIIITTKEKDTEEEALSFEDQNICYGIQNFTNKDGKNVIEDTITPGSPKHYSIRFDLSLSDKNNPENAVMIQANLFRLKER